MHERVPWHVGRTREKGKRTMFGTFKLRSTLSRNANADLDDTLRTKTALKSIGYFDTPSYGMTQYPDEPMFKGIEKFQRDNGLRRDGIMKPGGETATALGREIGESERETTNRFRTKQRSNLGRSVFGLLDDLGDRRANRSRDVVATKRALAWTGQFPRDHRQTDNGKPGGNLFDAVKWFQQKKGLKVDGWMRPNGETERELDRDLTSLLGDGKLGQAANRIENDRRSGGDAEPGSKSADHPSDGSPRSPEPDGDEVAFVPAVPFALWLMPILGAATAAAAMAIYNQLGKARQGELRRQYEEEADDGDDPCYRRYVREYNRCSLQPQKWRSDCRERATIRWDMCNRNGGEPDPNEPPEWSKGDMEVSPPR